ncbi:MAG: type II toxin-antitoxin system HicB family antitoxin [Desulfovibrio sp.]|jgi:antitoxin HicB|nr:type II toxin-antitoxin system HicB family antitoxin [Desulfovibrio sp.]
MEFPVILTPDEAEGGYVVTFSDIPEAITQGETEEESLRTAPEALENALKFYFDDGRSAPSPTASERGQHVVELPHPRRSAKILLLNEMAVQKIRPAELAQRLQTSRQKVSRLTNLQHTTRIDAAIRAFGRRMEVRVTR